MALIFGKTNLNREFREVSFVTYSRSLYWLIFALFVFSSDSFSSKVAAQGSFEIPETRLQALDPDNPEDYRDLAEELSVVKNSVAARDLTTRLYLICAANGVGKVRRSALRGLIQTARSKDELQRFKALAYLQDAQFSILLYPGDSKAPEAEKKTKTRDAVDDKVLDALRSLRRGKHRRAKKVMEDQTVRTRFGQFEKLIPVKEFLQACESGAVSDSLLLRIIQMDTKVVNGDNPETVLSEETDVAWRFIFKNRIPPRVPNIDFDSVTEFDPSKSVFRNGIWRSPPKN